jgi:hypothetical protein
VFAGNDDSFSKRRRERIFVKKWVMNLEYEQLKLVATVMNDFTPAYICSPGEDNTTYYPPFDFSIRNLNNIFSSPSESVFDTVYHIISEAEDKRRHGVQL